MTRNITLSGRYNKKMLTYLECNKDTISLLDHIIIGNTAIYCVLIKSKNIEDILMSEISSWKRNRNILQKIIDNFRGV